MSSVSVDLPDISSAMIQRGALPSDPWYTFFETLWRRVGGEEDRVAGAEEGIDAKADKTLEISTTGPLSGGGTLDGDIEISFTPDEGWTAATGTANKGAYAAYSAGTASATYTQAEVQSLMDQLEAASQRIKALEDALFDRGVISA